MAQQISHNVVELPQSTSGSPLVDVASNQITTDAAFVGSSNTHHTSLNEPSSQSEQQPAPPPSNSDATKPSAGDVSVPGSTDELSSNLLSDKSHAAHGDQPTGNPDDGGQGGGGVDDRSAADFSIDASANSDTDTSRADALERKDGNNHNRTNSVKKPATFSKVSVSKNFLAKTATTPVVTATKLGEKSSPAATAAQPFARPRLVAKTGTSLQNIQKARIGTDGASGPDASKVWNKNQPARPPPPKHFTDEELKQQYGIHLANRLQADEGGKESKWADIDDDEDDWAPEAVTWVDGTKATLTVQEAVTAAPNSKKEASPAPAVREPKPTTPKPEASAAPPSLELAPAPEAPETLEVSEAQKSTEAAKPTLTSMKRPEQVMKILRPGAAASLAKQSGNGSGLSHEKPSLKAKSPAPAPPAKSPWAPVPKVESVSPINPPMQQAPVPHAPPQPLATQDARAYDQNAQIYPAREIAADTFDRSWRDGERGNRELFNSTNGRYEPVQEGRRNQIRPEPAYRKPAVLQRPTHSPNNAEPLSARSGSQSDSLYGRRRESNVSQGSLPQNQQLPGSRPANASVSPNDQPGAELVAAATQGDNVVNQPPVQPAPQEMAPPSEPAEPVEDPLKMQERIMREKRELAIKRRKEEEEREEIAKQERLRAKLAALEGAGKSKKERDAEAAAQAAAAASAAAQAKLAAEQSKNDSSSVNPPSQNPGTAVGMTPSPALPNETQPAQAPTDARRNEPTVQLPGLHQQASEAKSSQPFSQTVKSHAGPTTEHAVPGNDPTKAGPRNNASPRANTRAPYQQSSAPFAASQPGYSSAAERKSQQPFGRSPNLNSDSSFSPWPKAPASSSVWGTSGIGNGTFDSSSNFAPLSIGPSSSLPPPPGMGRQSASTRISPQGFSSEERAQQQPPQSSTQPAAEQRAFPPGIEARTELFPNQSRLNGVAPTPGLNRPAHPPGPIGPPSRAQLHNDHNGRATAGLTAWQSLSNDLPAQYRASAEAAAEMRAGGANTKPVENTFRETFKKTIPDPSGRLGAPRKYESPEYTVHDASNSAGPIGQAKQSAPFAANVATQDPWRHPNDPTIRTPEGDHSNLQKGTHVQQAPIGPPAPGTRQAVLPPHLRPKAQFPTMPIDATLEPNDQSPPPPETETHPVNSGDVQHPQVKLPPPTAKVKLPPASAPATTPAPVYSGHVVMPPRQTSAYGPPGAARPIVQNGEWQLRFNGLFNRTAVSTETPPSPPKTPPKAMGPALAVASSTRATMEDQSNALRSGATVSLPQGGKPIRGEGLGFSDDGGMSSKPTIAQLFDEERSFGSLPRILIPRNTRYNLTAYPMHTKYPRTARAIEAHSKEPLGPFFFYKDPAGYHLKIIDTRLRNKLVRTAEPNAVSGRAPRRTQERPANGKPDRPRGSKEAPAAASANDDAQRKLGHKRGAKSVPAGGQAPSDTVTPGEQAASSADKRASWAKPPRGGSRRASHHPTPAPAS